MASDCPAGDVLERLIDGQLPPGVATPLRGHVRGCDGCRQELRAIADRRASVERVLREGGTVEEVTTEQDAPLIGLRGEFPAPDPDDAGPTRAPGPGGTSRRIPESEEVHLPPHEPGADGGFDAEAAVGETTVALPKGEQLGRYVILEQLGVGGMGVVYAAFDPELNRKVALKLLRTAHKASGSVEARARLFREAQAMARLSHPNIVHVYDVGSIGDEVYIAMELVEGTTLARWLKTRRGWREVVRLFLLAGRGLAAAHAAGLVHRDFKPDNVLVANDGRIRVTDFGLARPAVGGGDPSLIKGDDSEDPPNLTPDYLVSPLTRVGTIVGTPVYMAPEQFLGEAVDARTDQYSFCVALFEALYGELPYKARSVRRLAKKALAGKLPRWPPDARVPLTLHRILLRGLKPRRDQRWPSMNALLSAVELVTWLRRRFAWAAAALLAAGAIVGGMQLRTARTDEACVHPERKLDGVWDDAARAEVRAAFEHLGPAQADRAFQTVSRQLDRYLGAWTSAHTQACDATFVQREQPRDVLALRLQCLEQRRRELAAFVQLLGAAEAETVTRAVQSASTFPDLSTCADIASLVRRSRLPANEAERKQVETLRGKLAEVEAYRVSGQYPEAVKLASVVAGRARELRFRPLEAEAFLLLGRLRDPTGDYRGAEQALQEAVYAAEAAQLLDLEAEALIELVTVVGQRQSRHAEGHGLARHAAAVLEALSDPPRLTADLVDNVGTLFRAEGDYEQALVHHQRALALRERHLGPEHLSVAPTLQWMGMTYTALSRNQEALACYERALKLIEAAYGSEHPRTSSVRNWHGLALVAVGHYDQALAAFRHSLAADAQVFGATNPSLAYALNGIALSLMHLRRHDEAITTQERAIAVADRALGPTHPRVATFHILLSQIHLQKGDAARALETGLRAQQIRENALGPDHFDLGQSLYHVADAYLALGRPRDALPLLERALKLREGRQAYPEMLAMIRFALARALVATGGDAERARTLAGLAAATIATDAPQTRTLLAEVRAWQRTHGGGLARAEAP